MTTEKQYVAGFLFSEDKSIVTLILKTKPAWQAGRLNGIGGKIEEGETPEQAMIREFTEETGVTVVDWRKFCTLSWRGGCVYFFTAFGDVNACQTTTDEEVRRLKVEHLDVFNCIPNLRWLIPMALDSHIGHASVEDIS